MGLAKDVLLAVALASGARLDAAPLVPRDLPAGHWAATAARELVEAGILTADGGLFRGEGTIRRHDLAVIVARVLGRLASDPGAVGAADRAKLSALAAELRSELAGLGERLATQAALRDDLATRIDRLKAGSGAGAGPRPAFTGLVSVALVGNDEGASLPLPAGGLTPSRSRFAFPLEQEFFTLPQASMALDRPVGDGLALHLQLDYATDGLNPLFGGVGVNEAYLVKAGVFGGGMALKVGGFALSHHDWELDGAFRTATRTITLSALGTFFEAVRVAGIELREDGEDFGFRLAIFSGADLPLGAGVLGMGFLSDGAGLQALAGSNTFDQRLGYSLDVVSAVDPEARWGWRFGVFSLGGDPDASPVTGSPSAGIKGWQAGVRHQVGKAEVLAHYLDAENDAALAGRTDQHAWYLMVDLPLGSRDGISLRWDDWENDPVAVGAAGTEGDAITLAFRRQLGESSRLQLEALFPDEEGTGVVPAAADFEDDILQARYTVWF